MIQIFLKHMQHTAGPKEGLGESCMQNLDKECVDVQHCMRVRSIKNMSVIDTEQQYTGTEAVLLKK